MFVVVEGCRTLPVHQIQLIQRFACVEFTLNFLLSLTALALGAPFIVFSSFPLHQHFTSFRADCRSRKKKNNSLSLLLLLNEFNGWFLVFVLFLSRGALRLQPPLTHSKKGRQTNHLFIPQPSAGALAFTTFNSFSISLIINEMKRMKDCSAWAAPLQ